MASTEFHRTIYLAGGFRSGWQKSVIQQLPGYSFLDPSQHNIQNPSEYTKWDLEAIRASDIVLGNMEATNPGGFSLALEIGFARCLDKTVILVDQIEDPSISRYFEMVRQCSDFVFKSLDQAIEYLADAHCSR
jgi:nucleoside 2-deoxyribosyltransferase